MKQLCSYKGCRIEDPNQEGLTPLHVAAMRGDAAMVRTIQGLLFILPDLLPSLR